MSNPQSVVSSEDEPTNEGRKMSEEISDSDAYEFLEQASVLVSKDKRLAAIPVENFNKYIQLESISARQSARIAELEEKLNQANGVLMMAEMLCDNCIKYSPDKPIASEAYSVRKQIKSVIQTTTKEGR